MGQDERQTQDERTRGGDAAEDAREEFTDYRQDRPDRAGGRDGAAEREAEMQPDEERVDVRRENE